MKKGLVPTVFVVFGYSLLLFTGCSGQMNTTFVSNNMSDIAVEPTDARTVRMDCTECYWWTDKDNRVCLSGRGMVKSLIHSRYDREFILSFVLDTPSQGMGKNYQLTHTSTRGMIRSGGNIYRFQGTYGIMGTENRNSDRLIGAYRSGITINAAKLFGGWSKPVPFLIFGTFTAVPDREGRGAGWRNQTEADGYVRKFPDRVRVGASTPSPGAPVK